MKQWLPALLAGLLCAVSAQAHGLLVPADASLPPLALVRHEVKATLVEQVATTEVTQVFRNHTDRVLEATYIFPVPAGASVNRFSMWVDGKEVKGEMVEADKARQIYTDIVRRTQDPGLLEYMGQDLLKLRVFPVPARGEQKLALRFTAVCNCEGGLVEYVYPLKTDQKGAEVLEKFTLDATIESQRKVHNVYSPTHAVTVTPRGDNKAKVHFEATKTTLDRDLKLYFSLGKGDVGMTALTYRPDAGKDGSFMLLISPRAELAKHHHVARDMVFVLDTSGSMAGKKMEQAKKALKHCLSQLHANDRFAVMNFATTVQHQHDTLQSANSEHLAEARQWIDDLEPTGGTAIDDALAEAMAMRTKDGDRPFTIVFFTDGQPTVGEQDPEKIIKHVEQKNTGSTRIFTFGVGDDVNAALLDRLADMTRSVSSYVRPEEDIEIKASNLFARISHPVMTDLHVAVGTSNIVRVSYSPPYINRLVKNVAADVTLKEMYPKQLPDLFHGGQIVVCGRYKGHGNGVLKLNGTIDGKPCEMVYDVTFPEKTGEEKAFVENLWARRKVAYLLDQIRTNGQQKELTDEVIRLAKKHGIATPYTSYLVVPDTVATNVQQSPTVEPVLGGVQFRGAPSDSVAIPLPPGSAPAEVPHITKLLMPETRSSPLTPLLGREVVNSVHRPTSVPVRPGNTNVPNVTNSATITPAKGYTQYAPVTGQPAASWGIPTSEAPAAPPPSPVRFFERGGAVTGTSAPAEPSTAPLPQAGKEGVELALVLDAMRSEERVKECKAVQVSGRTCREFNGVWVDEAFKAGMKVVTNKAMGDAYFKLLAKQPTLKDLFHLGNHLVWVTPSGTVLVVDTKSGSDKLTDTEIDALFAAPKK